MTSTSAEEASKEDFSLHSGQTGTRYPSLAETELLSCTGKKSKRIHSTEEGCTNCLGRGCCVTAKRMRSATRKTFKNCSGIFTRTRSIRPGQHGRHWQVSWTSWQKPGRTERKATNRVWRTLRPKLRRDGPARANPCSSGPGTSRGGSAMDKVSVPREPGRQRIGSIPSHHCGRSSLSR